MKGLRSVSANCSIAQRWNLHYRRLWTGEESLFGSESYKRNAVEISHSDSRAGISKLFGHLSWNAINRNHLQFVPGWVLNQPKMCTTAFTDKNLESLKEAATTGWYKKLFKYLLIQHNIYLVEGMYDSLQSIILEWICTAIMFPSHTASYLKCTTVLLLAVLNGLSKLIPTIATHNKAF